MEEANELAKEVRGSTGLRIFICAHCTGSLIHRGSPDLAAYKLQLPCLKLKG